MPVLLAGTRTDANGAYTLKSNNTGYTQVHFSFLGYKAIVRNITPGQENTIDVALKPEAQILQEVEVKPEKVKEKYRNKNNPAVDLIRQVVAHKNQNRIESYNYVQYEQYEKLMFSLSNMSDKFRNKKLFKKYTFLFDNVDSTKVQGKVLLPIYLQETLSDNYYRKDPSGKKAIVKAKQEVSFDDYIDNQGLSTYLNHLYQDIDIYDNNISLLTNQFLSPIADMAPTFYKFYIQDTLKANNPPLVELMFVPRNKSDFMFQGKMYVTLDSNYAVQKVDMSVNKDINLNWVREMYIRQDFEKGDNGRYHMVRSNMMADFGISKDRGGLFGERTVSYRNFTVNKEQPDSTYRGDEKVVLKGTENHTENFWIANRHDSLTNAESKVYANIDSLQKNPFVPSYDGYSHAVISRL